MIIQQVNYKKNNKNLPKHMNNIYNSKLYKHNNNIDIKKPSFFSNKKQKKLRKSNFKSSLSNSRIFFNYLRENQRSKNKKQNNNNFIFNSIKNKQISRLKKKLAYLRNKIRFSKVYRKFVKNSIKPKVWIKSIKKKKNKPILPWILQGREQQLKLEHTLMFLLFRLNRSQTKKNNKIATLRLEDTKLIKQYRKKAKFSKFGRYGTHAKSRIKVNKLFKFKSKGKTVKPIKNKIKRQHIYLQNKRLSIINNGGYVLFYKYIYMLVIIWYILNNIFSIKQKKIFNCEIWFNYFLKNLWIQQTCSLNNNGYLNYSTITSFKSTPQSITLYNPINNTLNYQLKPLRNFDRLFIGISNKRQLINIRNKLPFKRKSKIRRFFKISPKLKNNKKMAKFFFNKKTKKKVKMQKRLSAPEWLLMSKFTRKKYQDKFSTVFSQWKNVKQIQKYINKQSQVWHQPYFITHPYYYTNRYNTFIYQMAQE